MADHKPHGIYEKCIKRLFDVVMATTAVVLLSPVMLTTAILVRTKLGSPVLFTQERPGKDEKIFKLYKFRTMTDARDSEGNLLPDKDRLPEFGRKLRATSLDELPELFNIIKGDMSFIGPRPLLVSYLPWYTDEERLRHTVRPGLTGLAQISGRNFIGWDERFKKDVEYVRTLSFATDMMIIFRTFAVLFDRKQIAEDTNAAEGNFAEIRRAQKEQTNREQQ